MFYPEESQILSLPVSVIDLLIMGKSSGVKSVLAFLTVHPEPLVQKDIAAACKISPRTVGRALKTLRETGLILSDKQPARTRYLIQGFSGLPHIEEKPVDPGLIERIERLEHQMEQDRESIRKLTEENERLKQENERLRAAPLPSLGGGITQPETKPTPPVTTPPVIPVDVKLDFESVFNVRAVDIPDDMIPAMQKMLTLHKAGKLVDLKSPLAYLRKIHGTMPVNAVCRISEPQQQKQSSVLPPNVDMDIALIKQGMLNDWNALTTDAEKQPFVRIAEQKAAQMPGAFKPPIMLLAKNAFFQQHHNAPIVFGDKKDT